uniref:RING-type E3 ubiquitin transferase n=3 Tax=Aegilops tauschii TaxID=37682 RepID=A0A453TCL7_AEGTS
ETRVKAKLRYRVLSREHTAHHSSSKSHTMRAPPSLLHRTALAAPGTGQTSLSSSPQQQEQTAPVMPVNSDMVVILASLLCALVCVLGLALVSRCACRRRRSASSSDHSPPPPKGLKKKAIDALPTVSFAATASPKPAGCSSSECAICLAEFTEGEGLRVLPRCGHRFHVACVDAWLRTCATCPSCRAPIIVSVPVQPPATPTVVVVVAAHNRCGRCGEVAAPAGGEDSTTVLP